MMDLYKIALRNLLRYKRRTLLTASLITIGVVFVLVFMAVSGSFKAMMIGQITDAMLGHIQIHKKGYVASIDNLPLNLNLKASAFARIEETLQQQKDIEAYSPRLKFGGLFSNFSESTNIRLNGVYPEREFKTVPLLTSRIAEGKKTLGRGEIFIPSLLAIGMKVKVGDPVVIVATNKDGSVNGKPFVVAGILESVTGPGGRDGYLHIEDAADVLRMPELEISEVAIRLKDFDRLQLTFTELEKRLASAFGKDGKFPLEIHTWEGLTPFFNIARMLDVMTFFIKLMLVALVLISVLNVMIMAVYERIREIGTMAAIGTPPGKILALFMLEGFSLGILGTLIGCGLGVLLIFILNLAHITFNFGQQRGLLLEATVHPGALLSIAGIVIIVSVLASLQPAFKASRMEPINALRHV
ncbi:putative ABC transport system permease protein [Syntrophus gentianae]|uniref:Putative ABC transport system permease protein n=1 Tax=Syntrophus gentianae TaxID=43775 RepID=A0A1H7ZXE1_9BACT|nr:FtsX-like permease family protein [Syntrophus gentianae]SEM62896.1 putative ABC transport system permease protein [Syntrophus gentianae]